jgi:hypothetical protein
MFWKYRCVLFARSQASAAVYLNSSVFWDVTQRRLVSHRRFGTTHRSRFQGSSCQKVGCVTSQKTEEFMRYFR